jgi:hypothetical protein
MSACAPSLVERRDNGDVAEPVHSACGCALARQGNRIWCARCGGIGAGLPLPLAGACGGGLGWGLSPHWDGRELRGMSPSGENPHPPRSPSASASPAGGKGGASPQSSRNPYAIALLGEGTVIRLRRGADFDFNVMCDDCLGPRIGSAKLQTSSHNNIVECRRHVWRPSPQEPSP